MEIKPSIDIEKSWKKILTEEFEKPYFLVIKQKLLAEMDAGYRIFPESKNIFNAFNLTPFDQVKVVIIGQDPYHGLGQAHGLCFSVAPGIRIPPSLLNILKELKSDLGIAIPSSGDLTPRAKQGVLLLNATLTVRENTPNSHKDFGWQNFTDQVIKNLSDQKEGLVFLLRGAFAQQKQSLIDRSKHFIFSAAHPSPFSAHRGFLGSRPFSQCNEALEAIGKPAIDWRLS